MVTPFKNKKSAFPSGKTVWAAFAAALSYDQTRISRRHFLTEKKGSEKKCSALYSTLHIKPKKALPEAEQAHFNTESLARIPRWAISATSRINTTRLYAFFSIASRVYSHFSHLHKSQWNLEEISVLNVPRHKCLLFAKDTQPWSAFAPARVRCPCRHKKQRKRSPFLSFKKSVLTKEASAAVSEVARSFVPVFFRILTLYSFLQTILPRGTP